jgi:D-alanyl-D-alanine carboxypeptidase
MNSLKSWGFQYGKFLGRKPSSWLAAVFLLMLSGPGFTAASLDDISSPRRLPVGRESLVLSGSSSMISETSSSTRLYPYPVNDGTKAPQVTARGVYVVDADSMVPLLAKRPNEKLRPASTTKIMTALVAMAAFAGDEVVTAGRADGAVGKTIHLKTGEQVTFSDMLYGLLLESGNDAAYALAENYPGGYEGMIAAMNQKAAELGMVNTEYRNVSGVDQYRHETTARDLAILTKEAMENELLREIVATKSKEIVSLDGTVIHQLTNTNELLGEVPGVVGVKTGTTDLAGECLITLVEREGRRVILVMLGSSDRFGETKLLIDWVFGHHKWENVILPLQGL